MDDAALAFILRSKQGRRWMWKHMGDCGLTMNPYANQREATDFNCGRQSVAQALLVDIQRVDAAAFPLMINEAMMEEDSHDNRSNTNLTGSNGDGNDNERKSTGDYNPLD